MEIAKHYLGYPFSPYIRSDRGYYPEKGFDCLGFVLFVLRLSKLYIPELIIPQDIRHANEMHDSLGVSVHKKDAKLSNLVFFLMGTILVMSVYSPEKISIVIDI